MNQSREEDMAFGTLLSKLGRREIYATILICIFAASVIYLQMSSRYPSAERRNLVGVIKVEGYIETSWTVAYCTDLISQAVFNESVKAVVLVVDSAGGYADYVERIYLDLLELKAKKPLVASITTALSGGYYIAVAADHIFVPPTSFVGSIGVIGRGPPVLIPQESVMETGAHKATGFSKLLFPLNLSHALDNFVSAVEKSRGNRLKLSSTQLRRATIYLGSEAVAVGLADEAGSFLKAVEKVAKQANLVQYEVAELVPRQIGVSASWQGSSNVTSMRWENITLRVLDEIHPPPAVHYIYLPPQAMAQGTNPFASPATQDAREGDVLVDTSHGNQILWWDIDILIAELAKRNVTVSFISQWYDLESKLESASCFIVASPTEVYSETECKTIEKFVDDGGLLLLFFDPAWEYLGYEGLAAGIIAPVNSISTRFGFSFAKGYLYNEEEHYGIYRNIYAKNFSANSLTTGLRSLLLCTATHIYSMQKGLAWTSVTTYSSVAERADSYAVIALAKRGNGAVAAFGDLTFLSEPYCFSEDNYQLILNLVSLIAETETRVVGTGKDSAEQIGMPILPDGTEKIFTEWADGKESSVRWLKVSETEIRIERPQETTYYYLTEGGSLRKWVSDGTECTYDSPLPGPPYPLARGKSWEYASNFTVFMQGNAYSGSIVGKEEVEDLESVSAQNGATYFCARVKTTEVEGIMLDGQSMRIVTTAYYWVSSDVGTVKQDATIKYYLNGLLTSESRRTLILRSVRVGQSL